MNTTATASDMIMVVLAYLDAGAHPDMNPPPLAAAGRRCGSYVLRHSAPQLDSVTRKECSSIKSKRLSLFYYYSAVTSLSHGSTRFTLHPDRHSHSDTNSSSLRSILAMLQLEYQDYSFTLSPLSTARGPQL